MEKVTIGTILKNRISEQGYKQEEFAEKAGVSISALRKYMNGKVAYSYELMEVFARLLDCSYDYLLGKSKSPRTEYRELGDLRLSDEALDMLMQYAEHYETDINSNMYIRTLDAMIRVGNLIPCMANYMIKESQINKMFETIGELIARAFKASGRVSEIVVDNTYAMDGESIQLIYLVSLLKDAKSMVGADFAEELRELQKNAGDID